MSHSSLYRRILTAAVCSSLTLGGIACNGNVAEEELEVGEATAMLTSSEESGDLAGDAVAGESTSDLNSSAESEAVLPEEPGDADGVCDFGARRKAVMAKYDVDGSGRLEPAERQSLKQDLADRGVGPMAGRLGVKARHHVLSRVRWVFDEDGNHQLSADERTALVDAMEARCERVRAGRLEKFDANQDGKLDETERLAAKQAFRDRVAAIRQQALSKYDANGNGFLDPAERAQFKADRLTALQSRRAALVAKYDTDGDGKLSPQEALPLKQEIQKRIIEGLDAE